MFLLSLSTQEIIKLLKTTNQAQNRYLGFLINPCFQRVNRLLMVKKVTSDIIFQLLKRKNFFGQLIKNDFKKYDNIRKIAKGQCDSYKTGYLWIIPISKNSTN